MYLIHICNCKCRLKMHRNGNRDRSKIISWDQVTEFKQSEHNTVNEILLSDADLIDACSSELLPLLSLVSSLCVLDLSFNNLSDNFWICNTSTKNNSTPFSRFLVESSDSLTKWPSLTTINLSNNWYGRINSKNNNNKLLICVALRKGLYQP